MTPCSFQLLLAQCNHLGLVAMRCKETSGPEGCEFPVRLVNAPAAEAQEDINVLRTELSRRIWRQRAPLAEERPASPLKQSSRRAQTPSLRKRLSLKYVHPFKRR